MLLMEKSFAFFKESNKLVLEIDSKTDFICQALQLLIQMRMNNIFISPLEAPDNALI